MFNTHKLLKQKNAVGTLLTNNEIQFLSSLFTYLLPAVGFSLILCVPPIVRARILCLLTLQVPGAVRPISNNIVDVARLVKQTVAFGRLLIFFLCYRYQFFLSGSNTSLKINLQHSLACAYLIVQQHLSCDHASSFPASLVLGVAHTCL